MGLATNQVFDREHDGRLRYVLIGLLKDYGVAHWTLVLSHKRQTAALLWRAPCGLVCSIDVPNYDAPDEEWVRAADLLAVKLKLTR